MDLDAESTAATDLEIPADAKELIGVILAMGGIVLATATGGPCMARFKTGFPGGPFQLGGPAMSSLNTDPGLSSGFIRSVDIPMHKAVEPKAEMDVTMEHGGVDLGTIYLGYSAEFECG